MKKNNSDVLIANQGDAGVSFMLSKEEFKLKLKGAGWTQARLARAMNRSPSWLNKIITGTRGMNHKHLFKIAVITGIPPNELLGWEEGGKTKPPSDDRVVRESVEQVPLEFLKRFVAIGQERISKEENKK